jgi:hypothetical protein
MDKTDYYREGLAESFDEHGIKATSEQLNAIAADVAGYAENESMAFYTPPWSDRQSDIEREFKAKYKSLQDEFDKYRCNAEKAVGKALRQYDDSRISIGEYGEVFRHDGRTEQIQ